MVLKSLLVLIAFYVPTQFLLSVGATFLQQHDLEMDGTTPLLLAHEEEPRTDADGVWARNAHWLFDLHFNEYEKWLSNAPSSASPGVEDRGLLLLLAAGLNANGNAKYPTWGTAAERNVFEEFPIHLLKQGESIVLNHISPSLPVDKKGSKTLTTTLAAARVVSLAPDGMDWKQRDQLLKNAAPTEAETMLARSASLADLYIRQPFSFYMREETRKESFGWLKNLRTTVQDVPPEDIHRLPRIAVKLFFMLKAIHALRAHERASGGSLERLALSLYRPYINEISARNEYGDCIGKRDAERLSDPATMGVGLYGVTHLEVLPPAMFRALWLKRGASVFQSPNFLSWSDSLDGIEDWVLPTHMKDIGGETQKELVRLYLIAPNDPLTFFPIMRMEGGNPHDHELYASEREVISPPFSKLEFGSQRFVFDGDFDFNYHEGAAAVLSRMSLDKWETTREQLLAWLLEQGGQAIDAVTAEDSLGGCASTSRLTREGLEKTRDVLMGKRTQDAFSTTARLNKDGSARPHFPDGRAKRLQYDLFSWAFGTRERFERLVPEGYKQRKVRTELVFVKEIKTDDRARKYWEGL